MNRLPENGTKKQMLHSFEYMSEASVCFNRLLLHLWVRNPN